MYLTALYVYSSGHANNVDIELCFVKQKRRTIYSYFANSLRFGETIFLSAEFFWDQNAKIATIKHHLFSPDCSMILPLSFCISSSSQLDFSLLKNSIFSLEFICLSN